MEPDGRHLVFHSNRTGRYDLYVKAVTGDAPETLLVESSDSESRNADAWSSRSNIFDVGAHLVSLSGSSLELEVDLLLY